MVCRWATAHNKRWEYWMSFPELRYRIQYQMCCDCSSSWPNPLVRRRRSTQSHVGCGRQAFRWHLCVRRRNWFEWVYVCPVLSYREPKGEAIKNGQTIESVECFIRFLMINEKCLYFHCLSVYSRIQQNFN